MSSSSAGAMPDLPGLLCLAPGNSSVIFIDSSQSVSRSGGSRLSGRGESEQKKVNLVSGPFRMYLNQRSWPKLSTKNPSVHRSEATEALRLLLKGEGLLFCFVLFRFAFTG